MMAKDTSGPLGGPRRPETPPDHFYYQASGLPRETDGWVVYRFDCYDAIEDCFVKRVAGPMSKEAAELECNWLRLASGFDEPEEEEVHATI